MTDEESGMKGAKVTVEFYFESMLQVDDFRGGEEEARKWVAGALAMGGFGFYDACSFEVKKVELVDE